VDKLLVLLVLVHVMVLMVLLMVLLLSPLESVAFLLNASTRSSFRGDFSRQASKGVSNSSHSNRLLHRANPWEKLSTPFICVAKSWVPKFMLANPSGSKTRTCLSSHV